MAIKFNLKTSEATILKELLKKSGFSQKIIKTYTKSFVASFESNILNLNSTLFEGQEILITLKDEINPSPQIMGELNIVYEDEFFLLINKPKNLATIATKAHFENNLAGIVSYYYKKNNINSKIHFINRLDYLTSGLILLAKHQYIHSLLSKQKIIKKYRALVLGNIKQEHGFINMPITRSKTEKIKRVVSKEGSPALTEYYVINHLDNSTLVKIILHSGKTHQIRVHFQNIGHPLVGDPLYSENDYNTNPFYLESYYIAFFHPFLKEEKTFEIL